MMGVWTSHMTISVWKLVVFFLANLGVISGLYIHWTRIDAQRQHWISSFITQGLAVEDICAVAEGSPDEINMLLDHYAPYL